MPAWFYWAVVIAAGWPLISRIPSGIRQMISDDRENWRLRREDKAHRAVAQRLREERHLRERFRGQLQCPVCGSAAFSITDDPATVASKLQKDEEINYMCHMCEKPFKWKSSL